MILKSMPNGLPSPKLGETVDVIEEAAPTDAPASGGLLVKIVYFSVDPYLRGAMGTVGKPMRGFVAGKVLKVKNNSSWKENDLFGANLPFTTVQAIPNEQIMGFLNLTKYISEDELSLGIGLLGMPGSTAYAGLDLMDVESADRVWISAATGAVGSLAGQIAKNVKKCKLVLGSAGSKEKCEIATKNYGYDACFDYHDASSTEGGMTALVKKHAPEGLNFYFENVGGDHFQAAMNNMQEYGRIAVCGAISKYNAKEDSATGEPVALRALIYKSIRMEGFLCRRWLQAQKGNFLEDMSKWYREGLVTKQETVYNGIEEWPKAFHSLFVEGNSNQGKVVVRVE